MTDQTMESVHLEGGPKDFPEHLRAGRAPAGEHKVKIEHCGGYEHFERAGRVAPGEPVVFRWTARTRIAE
jgi:hypothetical protein